MTAINPLGNQPLGYGDRRYGSFWALVAVATSEIATPLREGRKPLERNTGDLHRQMFRNVLPGGVSTRLQRDFSPGPPDKRVVELGDGNFRLAPDLAMCETTIGRLV